MVYGKRTKADETNKEGGYKNKVYFAPVSSFTSIKTPIAVPVAAGDKVKIITAHTFGASDGFISYECKKHAVTHTSETTGDDGSKSLIHKFSFEMLGDSASTLEQMRDFLNDDLIVLLKDQDCGATEHIQFGDGCLTPDFNISFDGKTTKEGLKVYKVEGTVKDKKFFYTATVTEKP